MDCRPFRLALPALLALLLSACGFHLREPLRLPADLAGVQVVARNPYSPLAQSLTRSLERAGFEVPDSRREGTAVLRVLSERWDSQPISVDQFGRAQEFTLRYAAVFTFEGVDGEELVPEQVIELSRDYVSLPNNSTGSESEREMLSRELQRDMAAAVLRRIDTVNRAREQDAPAASQWPVN
ncbi:LPS-assembly lipoprotein LptE [Luteimonas terricola]|uniref:LPS-assembly lipoprotein LptE n=1 Tax=Luteimonas terricola TaxID=645597 RepID=A0ABQ2ED01_9GAMM|nr:LPS assembly lipoprotein LptE [Luteimonas terricola]GGK07351.1 LPS-assembly lipoprotein LptE [Luteimonas terricola]